MTTTYDKNLCPLDCAPGIKCDYCGPRASAEKSASGLTITVNTDPVERPARSIAFFTTRGAALNFDPSFMDEARCREWITSRLHREGARCPHCGLVLDGDRAFRAGRRVHCGRCGRWYTARSGTFLQGSQLSDAGIFLLATLLECKVSHDTIAELVGISADTVRLWEKKFRAFEG